MKAIGAKSNYQECSDQAGSLFRATGDSKVSQRQKSGTWLTQVTCLDSRSFLPELTKVIESGITVLVWAGDADWICNWLGNEAAVSTISFSGQEEFNGKELKSYTVDGKEKGTFKTAGNFSFLRVFEAGHEVPYYRKFSPISLFHLEWYGLTRCRARGCSPSFHSDYA